MLLKEPLLIDNDYTSILNWIMIGLPFQIHFPWTNQWNL